MILEVRRSTKGIGRYKWSLFHNDEYVEGGRITLSDDDKISSKSVIAHLEPMLQSYGLDTNNINIRHDANPYIIKYDFEEE